MVCILFNECNKCNHYSTPMTLVEGREWFMRCKYKKYEELGENGAPSAITLLIFRFGFTQDQNISKCNLILALIFLEL